MRVDKIRKKLWFFVRGFNWKGIGKNWGIDIGLLLISIIWINSEFWGEDMESVLGLRIGRVVLVLISVWIKLF